MRAGVVTREGRQRARLSLGACHRELREPCWLGLSIAECRGDAGAGLSGSSHCRVTQDEGAKSFWWEHSIQWSFGGLKNIHEAYDKVEWADSPSALQRLEGTLVTCDL